MSCCEPISKRKAEYNRQKANEIVSRFIRRQSSRRFIYPLGKDGQDGVLITPTPFTRLIDENTDDGDTPVKGGLLLI